MKKPSQEELQTMVDVRCASLIKRWLSGKKLSDDEKSYVVEHGHIPLEILNQGPNSPAAKEAVKGITSTRKHAKYKEKLPHYASLYGQTERTIKRWIRRGKELNDLPPLDHPELMAAWWRRCMDHQVPDYLLAVESKGDDRSTTGNSGEADPDGTSRSPRDFSDVQGLGLAENVAALRITHAINKKLWDEAIHADPPNDNLVQLRQKNFERSFNLLRVAEITLVEFQEKHGQLVNEANVRAELSQLFESLRLMRENMPRRILAELEKILPRRIQRVMRVFEQYLVPAIDNARASEDEIFRNLETLEGPDAVKKLLAA